MAIGGGYSGSLIRSQYATSDDVKSGFTPDPAHVGTPHDVPDGLEGYRAARQVPADTGAEYAGTAMPVDMANGYDLVLDTPVYTGPDAHDGPGWYGSIGSDDQFRELIEDEHTGTGERAYERETWAPPALQSKFEWYDDQTTQGFLPAKDPNTTVLMRGINAYGLNNPDRDGYQQGVRPGLFRQLTPRITRLQHRRRYSYDAQPLSVRDFLVPTDSNPEATPDVGPTLPAWLPGRAFHRDTRPALWRRPDELDSDELAADPVSVGDSVIGGDVV